MNCQRDISHNRTSRASGIPVRRNGRFSVQVAVPMRLPDAGHLLITNPGRLRLADKQMSSIRDLIEIRPYQRVALSFCSTSCTSRRISPRYCSVSVHVDAGMV